MTGGHPRPDQTGAAGDGREPDWRRSADYEALLRADRRSFAWEWLRRTKVYRAAWSVYLADRTVRKSDPRQFGLERFEDPALATPAARPVWSAATDRGVIQVRPADLFAPEEDRLDLHRLARWVTLDIGPEGNEHVLLSDGHSSVRLDVIEGTLIGGPASLLYLVEGARNAREPLATVRRLIGLIERRRFSPVPPARSQRELRWILELRVADALRAGASQQEIARVLFGGQVPDARWRVATYAYRRRVQRLVEGARKRLRQPIDRHWFVTVER